MDDKRILELALEALQRRKTAVESAIQEVNESLGGIRTGVVERPDTPLVAVRRRTRTAAERKRQSEKMKLYWAAKRTTKVSTPAETSAKRKTMTAAAKRAISRKLKAAWARRKAAAKK